MRVNTPSVTTSTRVRGPMRELSRARRPIVSPTVSPSVCAIRSAAARAASRRGSSTRILRPRSQSAPINASGTRVVLPAPGGATSTAAVPRLRASASSWRTASIGRGASKRMGPASAASLGCRQPLSAPSSALISRLTRPKRHAIWNCSKVELLAHLSKEAGLRTFAELSEKEILALAISLEEEHGRIYDEYAHALADNFPASAKVFKEMAAEEDEHRRWLIDLYRQKFGDHIPLIRSQDVKGFVKHQPIWLVRPLGLDQVRAQAEAIEYETRRFYEKALERASDASVRKLLGDLAAAERNHISLAQQLGEAHLTADARAQEAEAQRRMFVLQVVQPGLAGLMDGSVSTLAPLFAAAFATQSTWETFLVGMAASVGAGISMGFAE